MADASEVKIVEKTDERAVMEIQNDTGSALLTKYNVYPGIDIVFVDARMQQFSFYTKPQPNVLAINHCEAGCIECEFHNGRYLYMGSGDLSVGWRRDEAFCHDTCFPTSNYHGVSIVFDVAKAQPMMDHIFGKHVFDIATLGDRFCDQSDFGMVMVGNDDINLLFQELYVVPEEIQAPYYRLKVMEILLLLSMIDGKRKRKRNSLSQKQMLAVKKVHQYIVANVETKKTIEDFAKEHAISETVLKQGFKAIYGTSIRQYIKDARVREAKRLLLDTEESVLDISSRVGYTNSSKFAMAFQRHVGKKPKEFRDLSRIRAAREARSARIAAAREKNRKKEK